MNKSARLFFTAASFWVGMMLANITVNTLSLGILFGGVFYIGGYLLIPSLIWGGCTAMISNKSTIKS